MPGAARLGDKAEGIDAHGCIAGPHRVSGPIVQGSPDTEANGKPLARQGDMGIHKICCGPNIFYIRTGSNSVFCNGKRVARLKDATLHCGGVGEIKQGSSDVIIGNGAGRAFKMAAQTNAPFVFEGYDGEMTYGMPSEDHFVDASFQYGASKLPCGGLDCTNCKIFKDPATVHKDNDAWRKPVVKDGVVYPKEGTKGQPHKIPMPDEAVKPVYRIYDDKAYIVKKDKDGFPEFTIFETYLDDKYVNSGDEFGHFKAANARIGQLLKEDKGLADKMELTEKQAKHFMKENPSINCARGLTWHHHQETGKIQLVDAKLHKRFGHIGGMEIWGGGRPC
jgi:uncharacterized Zn-binding protein involved in type VI secretion